MFLFSLTFDIPLESFVVNCRTFNQTHSHTHRLLSVVSLWRDVFISYGRRENVEFCLYCYFVECENFAQWYYVEKENKRRKKNTFSLTFQLCHICWWQVWLSMTFKRFCFQFSNGVFLHCQWQHSAQISFISHSKRRIKQAVKTG